MNRKYSIWKNASISWKKSFLLPRVKNAVPMKEKAAHNSIYSMKPKRLKKKRKSTLTIAEHTRQKPKRKPLPADLPRIDVIHDIDESEKVCACGAELSRIGEDVCEKLDIIPAKIQVIRHHPAQVRMQELRRRGIGWADGTDCPASSTNHPQGNSNPGASCPCGGFKVCRCPPALSPGKDFRALRDRYQPLHHGRLDGHGGAGLHTGNGFTLQGASCRSAYKRR